MRAPTMVISFRETAGTGRGNAGDALAWVGVHAVDIRPQRHRDSSDARRPVLAMHMVNGKQGAEGHMVARSQAPHGTLVCHPYLMSCARTCTPWACNGEGLGCTTPPHETPHNA